jgi:hypothetical protein
MTLTGRKLAMAMQSELARVRTLLQTAELRPEERARIEALLAEAEGGDEVALARIEQVAFERGYQPVPGKDVPLPPGRVMVCPEDPVHYQTFEREIGETLRCPVHQVPLVPGESGD